MAATRLRSLLDQIEQLSGGVGERHGTDRQLLDDFSTRHDEAAFAELVARHGPLVLRVCRRVLHHEQDAEDAFQATFLVLARCVGSIRKREALADWLHGVAYRTAMKAKRSAARRRNHETLLHERTPPAASPTWDDVQAVLDEEILRLPALFRSAFVLCVLEGKTVPAAAAEVGWKEGTMSSRLTRARQRLQKQLARRGIKLAALLAALCVAEGVAKAISATLGQTVIRHGLLVAGGGSAAGAIPPQVAALATGVTRAMFLQKAKIAVVVLLTLGLFAAGASVLTQQLLKAEEKPSIVQPAVKPLAEPAKPAEDTIEVTGPVLDPDGKPVATARLYQSRWLKLAPSSTEDAEVDSLGAADAEGRFRVTLRPAADLLRPFTLIAAADGFGLNWMVLRKTDKTDDITLRLVKDQVVRGRLLNTEGKPIAGVTVQIFCTSTPVPDWLAKRPYSFEGYNVLYAPLHKVLRVPATDKDGRFEIAGLGADRAVGAEVKSAVATMPPFTIVTHEGYDPKRKAPTGMYRPPYFGPSFECAALPTRAFEGTVRETGSNKPVAGAIVEATPSSRDLAVQAITDAKGHYRMIGLLKADTYTVEVTPGNRTPLLASSVEVIDRPGLEAVTCDVELSRGVLVTGRVVDKITGKGVLCAVRWVGLPDNPFVAKFPKSYVRAGWTDLDGRFSLVTIPGPGVLLVNMQTLVAQLNRASFIPYKRAEFDEADRKRVKVVEKPGGSGLRGNVLRSFTVAGGGIEYLNNSNACKVVDLKEDAGPVTCDLTLDPGNTLTINLEDPDGKPLVGVMAAGVDAMGNMRWRLEAAACPVYALDPKQPRQLGFLHRERKLAAVVTVRGDEKEPPTVRLTPTSTMTGRLLDHEGQPLADVYLYLSLSEDFGVAERLSNGANTHTDKDGRFRLEGLIPGAKISFLQILKGGKVFVEETKTKREALPSGDTLDAGDIRVKARDP